MRTPGDGGEEMDKKTRKELERLENLTNAEKNLLGNLYGDLFGSLVSPSASSSGRDSERNAENSQRKAAGSGSQTTQRRKSEEPTAAELLDRVRKNHPNPLDDARQALKEAQALVSKTDELSQELSESNRKGMEDLANMMGDLGQIDPSAMNPGGAPLVSQKGIGPGQAPVQTATGAEVKAQEDAAKEPETDPMEELDALVGLTTIKHDVKELMAFVKIQKMREEAGLKGRIDGREDHRETVQADRRAAERAADRGGQIRSCRRLCGPDRAQDAGADPEGAWRRPVHR